MKRLFNILLVFLPVMTALAYTPAVMTMDVNSVVYWGRFQISTRDYRSIGIGVGKHVVCQFSGGYLDVDACIEHRYGILEMAYVPSFHYYVTDNRGNVRLVVDGNGTVEQRNDYYAYGGQWGDNAINQGYQPFKYSVKELDRVHGLDWYDSQARMYDPVLARWHTQDSKSKDYYNWSPYAYCMGNPINAVDPDGNSVWTKLAKASVKIGKKVAKHGAKALTEGATYAQAVADITDDINTLTDSEASTGSKVWAGISLASEALPLSVNDVKDVGKRLKHYKRIPYNDGFAKPHGGKRHNDEIDEYINNIAVDPEISHIRKNQKQVDIHGNTVGDNRPDIQYDKNGKHYNVEFDNNKSSSRKHKQRISNNDPDSHNFFFLLK